jgi:general secretion pathway protein G
MRGRGAAKNARIGATRRTAYRRSRGATLIEVVVGLAILAILGMLLVPYFLQRMVEAQVDRAIRDLRDIGDQITVYSTELGGLPSSLDDLPQRVPLDPWGREYQYLPATDKGWKGKARKDRFLVPLNSDFDLYSSGPDGRSVSPLTAKASRDDIIRADDGGFYGAAEDF